MTAAAMSHLQRWAKMKLLLRILLATCVIAVCLGATTAPKAKRAFLILPAAITQGDALKALVEFRWDEDEPVELDYVTAEKGDITYGTLNVFSADGREVPMIHPVTMPLLPTGRKRVIKGELFRIGLYTLEFPQRLTPGEYYAIADFSDAYCAGQNVRFVTQKRWFTVYAGKRPNA
jgi:hypothetical protein